jgi:hypothetical protein
MWVFFALFVILLIALALLTRARAEAFVDMGGLPEPRNLFKYAREMLDKYDKPEVWAHAARVMNKDPGELARMNLNINNDAQ